MPATTPASTRARDVDSAPAYGHGLTDVQGVALLASAVSIFALLHYYKWGQILLSGDAVAHINIARRVFDSRTPGPLQLGTVWLPLQHILTIPFIISDWGWSSGIGGAIPSMISYVLGAVGMYLLVRRGLESVGGGNGRARIAAWLATAIFAANPNLIYLQTTALNEPISLALLIWATLFFTEFSQAAFRGDGELAGRRLMWCGWLLAADMLVRYDGWFAGCGFIAAALLVIILTARVGPGALARGDLGLRRAFLYFVLINAFAPVLWFAYNTFTWGNPLEFATGPYSAKAIEERTTRAGDPHHPGWHSPYVAAQYFLRDFKLTLAEGRTQPNSAPALWERPWLPLCLAGTVLVVLAGRALLPWFLLWIPLPFYALAMAWGSVPIFIPQWWPFSYYNTRYGLQLLPAAAAFVAVTVYFLTSVRRRWWQVTAVILAAAFMAGSYASVWRTVPLCLREIRVNGGARSALDAKLGSLLAQLPASSTILMYTGEHGGALQHAQISLRRTINEGNFRLWQQALQAPAANADYVVAGSGDPVAAAVAAHPTGLEEFVVIHSPGQQPVKIYQVVRSR